MAKCCNTTTQMVGIKWTIEEVSEIESFSKVIGPELYLGPECLFGLSFMKNSNQPSIFLCNKSDSKISIERTIALFDCDSEKLHEESDGKTFELEKGINVDMIGVVRGKDFNNLLDNKLIIDLCVSIKEVVTEQLHPLTCDTDSDRKLKEDLNSMLENAVNSDISLQVGDERIPAHWSILYSRSPYFKKMFDSGMRESLQNSVTISDSSLVTVKKLIQFLYTADFVREDDFQELFDLYCAADKYEVMDLRTLCGHKMLLNVSVENVCQILQLSYRHKDKALKMGAINFIRSHSHAVFQTDGWKKFEVSEPEIAETISFCLNKNLSA